MVFFAHALAVLLSGKRVSRKGWGEGVFLHLKGSVILLHVKGLESIWSPTESDLFVPDWRVPDLDRIVFVQGGFAQALLYAQMGVPVRRKVWDEGYELYMGILSIESAVSFYRFDPCSESCLCLRHPNGEVHIFRPGAVDLVATDWYPIKEIRLDDE